ncbi:MAG: DUF167 domain-containing protein [Elusimicrobia bacterium]|nr:DUF167 domain-containing protein [Elusimicrobiota bacterium]
MIVKVRLMPGAEDNEIVNRIGSVLRVRVTAPAMDDKANATLKDYLAEFFEVPPLKVNILRGMNGCEKTVEIVGRSEEQFKQVMACIP